LHAENSNEILLLHDAYSSTIERQNE
jgi:hypothetical protein